MQPFVKYLSGAWWDSYFRIDQEVMMSQTRSTRTSFSSLKNKLWVASGWPLVPPPLLVSVHDLLPQPWTWSMCGQREPKSLPLLQRALCQQALNGHKENRGRSTNKGQRCCGQSSSFSPLPLKSNEFQGGCPHNAMVPHTPLSSHFPLLPGGTPKIKEGL